MIYDKKKKKHGDKMENAPGAISAGERHGDFEKREKAVGRGQPCEYQTFIMIMTMMMMTIMTITLIMRLVVSCTL